jgi:hypothetical protein
MRIVEGQREGGIESRGGRERPSPSTRRRRGGAGLGGGGGNRWSGGGEERRGRGRNGVFWLGGLAASCGLNRTRRASAYGMQLSQDWKVVGWTVEFVRRADGRRQGCFDYLANLGSAAWPLGPDGTRLLSFFFQFVSLSNMLTFFCDIKI